MDDQREERGRFLDMFTVLPMILLPPTILKWTMISSITGEWIFLLAAVVFFLFWLHSRYEAALPQPEEE